MILSDRWITNQCQNPTHKVVEHTGGIHYLNINTATPLELAEIAAQKDMLQTYAEMNLTENVLGVDIYHELTDAEKQAFRPMINPFTDKQVREEDGRKILSYGTSSFGYDVRLDHHFKIFTNINSRIIDPLDNNEDCYVDHEGDTVIIPPNSYVLGYTKEYFIIPKDVLAICIGKSTWARLGLGVNCTPIEPGFEGHVVIELANYTTLPLRVHADMGIAQFLFYKGNEPSTKPYGADRKYQFQRPTITTARL